MVMDWRSTQPRYSPAALPIPRQIQRPESRANDPQTSAVVCIADSSRTSREVRKVPVTDHCPGAR
jgi:hypothetical protein